VPIRAERKNPRIIQMRNTGEMIFMKNARNKILANLHVIRASDGSGEGRPNDTKLCSVDMFLETREAFFEQYVHFRGNQKCFLSF
jgi:hypothetical protein